MENNTLIMKKNADLSFTMATRLKQLREEKGLSHQRLSESLAKTLGFTISKDSLINYEVATEHHSTPYKNLGMRVEYLHALAAFYEVSTDYILGLTDTKSPSQDVKDACEITGLSEQSVRALLYFKKPEENNCFSDNEKDAGVLEYAVAMVDDFISFALVVSDNSHLQFNNYLEFRQLVEEHNEESTAWAQMNYDDKMHQTSKILRNFQDIISSDSGFYPVRLADAANLFRTVFCDNFKNYLQSRYPLK